MGDRPLKRRQSKTTHCGGNAAFSRHRHCRRTPFLRIAAALLAGWLLLPDAFAESDDERINRVKAAFVLNIARFVSWPPDALAAQHDRILLCLYRSDIFSQAVATIEGEPVSGRRLQTTRIQSLAESTPCHILLIAANDLKDYAGETRPDAPRPLLVIADRTDPEAPKQPLHDVIVSLVRNGSRMGFEINLERSRQAGLKMSSQLLKLAIIVDGS
ncbi:MAG: YfiR family protein [Gammaproteobacteria bacterium]